MAKYLASLTAKIGSRKTEEHIVTLKKPEKTFSNTSKSVVLEWFNDGRKKLRNFSNRKIVLRINIELALIIYNIAERNVAAIPQTF